MFWKTGPIVDSFLIPTGYERMLPPGVQLTVRARRRVLAQRGRGRVLDLGGADSHRSLWDRPGVSDVELVEGRVERRLDDLVDAGARFDTVFSVFRLITTIDLDAALQQVRRLLDDDGVVLFLEPGARPGSARTRRALSPSVTMATGWRVDRDIPTALRQAKLSITDLERHHTNTMHWWLRTLVEGSAHRALELTRPLS